MKLSLRMESMKDDMLSNQPVHRIANKSGSR